jgi:hypothetical protein
LILSPRSITLDGLIKESVLDEHRKKERVKAMIFTTVYEQKGHVLLGFLGDLTLQGAMVVGEKSVEIDRDITLQIEFRGADEIPQSRLIIPAHVAWSKLGEDLNLYHTGFEFLELGEQTKQIIEMIVERYKFDITFGR